jgi:uncharacterized protein YkwD/uncharacterized membrane protein required for colicin V production
VILVDLAILALLGYSAYLGSRRGGPLVALELLSFMTATVLAYIGYSALGSVIKSWLQVSLALADVAGYLFIWVMVELVLAIIMRYTIIRPHRDLFHLNPTTRITGGVLNAVKTLILITLSLSLFASLPLTANTKKPFIEAFIPHILLNISGSLEQKLAATLGHDLGQSFNFFTVTSQPESEEKINLGFTTTTVVVDEADETQMLILLNHERTSRGLHALTLNLKARSVARAYSTRMLAEGFFSHIDPDGHSPFNRMSAGGVKFGSAGENLALAPTLQLAHQGLMNSPGHRANILSKDYATVGIGIIDAGAYGLMITQDFTD